MSIQGLLPVMLGARQTACHSLGSNIKPLFAKFFKMTFEAQRQGEMHWFSAAFGGSVLARVWRLGFVLALPFGSCVSLGK